MRYCYRVSRPGKTGGGQVPADPQHPLPHPGAPASRDARLAVHEDQDQVLARELAAFPAEGDPIWEDLELLDSLEHVPATGPGPGPGGEPRPAGRAGPAPGGHPAAAAAG